MSFRRFIKGHMRKALNKTLHSVFDDMDNYQANAPTPYYENGKMGFLDNEMKPLCKAVYDEDTLFGYTYFQNDIGIVSKDGKYGMINLQCQEVTPFVYDTMKHLRNQNLAAPFVYVQKEKLMGLLNEKGQQVITLDAYEHLWLITKERLFAHHKDAMKRNLSGLFTFPEKKLLMELPLDFEGMQMSDLSQNILYIHTYIKKQDKKSVFIYNLNGEKISEQEFEGIANITDEERIFKQYHLKGISKKYKLAVFRQWVTPNTLKYGCLNDKGEIAIPPKFDEIKIKNDRIKAVFNGRKVILNQYGDII